MMILDFLPQNLWWLRTQMRSAYATSQVSLPSQKVGQRVGLKHNEKMALLLRKQSQLRLHDKQPLINHQSQYGLESFIRFMLKKAFKQMISSTLMRQDIGLVLLEIRILPPSTQSVKVHFQMIRTISILPLQRPSQQLVG